MAACIDLTSSNSIAGKTLHTLTSENKLAANAKIQKTLKKTINKNVKDVVLNVLKEMNTKHLTLSVVPASNMVHKLKPTMQQLLDTERAIKVGD